MIAEASVLEQIPTPTDKSLYMSVLWECKLAPVNL